MPRLRRGCTHGGVLGGSAAHSSSSVKGLTMASQRACASGQNSDCAELGGVKNRNLNGVRLHKARSLLRRPMPIRMNMCPARPTAIRAHTRSSITRGLCALGWPRVKLCARVESSVALAEQLAVRTAAELHGCCRARVSLAAALLRQHIDGVARGRRAGHREQVARALPGPAHRVGHRRERRTVGGSGRARRRIVRDNGCYAGSSAIFQIPHRQRARPSWQALVDPVGEEVVLLEHLARGY